MIVYIVVFELIIRGVYTCGADASIRLKELGGGEVMMTGVNRDID
jgi:hypothetical protein